MEKIVLELERRGLPYVAKKENEDTILLFAVGYTPFLFEDNSYEIGGYYPASNYAYKLGVELSKLGENFRPNPNANYKQIAEECGLGVRGKNDLLFTEKFGSLCAFGCIRILDESEEILLKKPQIECENCGICQKLCPNQALSSGFEYPKCLRGMMDDGVPANAVSLLSKSILGCNVCSVNCPRNCQDRVRPKKEMSEILFVEEFLGRALKGKKELKPLGDIIGHNMIRPARMLTLATYGLLKMDEKYLKWLDKLSEYPDERVRTAVERVRKIVSIRP